MVSVIIPFYNEEDVIEDCLISLSKQTHKPLEIILIDDGSTDNSVRKIKNVNSKLKSQISTLLSQDHKGPAIARNLGVLHTKGDILVFVDADMEFDKAFITQLVKPIIQGKAKGTFSKEEYLKNPSNVWALCWNIQRFINNRWRLDNQAFTRILPISYPDTQPVFRAIRKDEFERAGGFDAVGYTDDWTLSRKLGYQASSVKGAVFYHRNPHSLPEVFQQASWLGGNEFITGSIARRVYNAVRYFFPLSLLMGILTALETKKMHYILFKLVYDAGVFYSILTAPGKKMKH